MKHFLRLAAPALLLALLSACASTPMHTAYGKYPRSGGYYGNDGPGPNPPRNFDNVANAVPHVEPLARGAARPYSVNGVTYYPDQQYRSYRMVGIASWYGFAYQGHRTSTGEIYDMYGRLTAASPTIRLPGYARVTNATDPSKSIIVRVNDRGPFVRGRIMDLSYAAAAKLGLLRRGSGKVIVDVIDPRSWNGDAPPVTLARSAPAREVDAVPSVTTVATASPGGGYLLQLGAFTSQDNARQLQAQVRNQWQALGQGAEVHYRAGLYRVQLGPYPTAAEAQDIAGQIQSSYGQRPAVVAIGTPAP